MRKLTFSIIALMMVACSTGGHDHHNGDSSSSDENPNQALYNQVMDIHDEVMPKMDEIERLKRELKERIANTPTMTEENRQQLEQTISNLDSAGISMMDWMHKFNPLPDSTDQEKAREYLESEMERIKKVRDRMMEALEKAKEVTK